ISKMAVEKELTKAGYSKADIDEIKQRIDRMNQAVEVTAYKIPLSKEADDKAEITKEVPCKPVKVKKTQETEMDAEDAKVFEVVDEMPEFQGGNLDKFLKWVQSNVKYPPIAMENSIQGTVVVSFVVGRTGEVKKINIARGVDPSLDEAVINVLKSAPYWKPGLQRGKPVNVQFSIPIKFNLN
ncbi:MAG: energy transducer TonB, partial [Bacteroidia bacterium]|nr:energy transducer TonB [Bacteroidia bacterium]